MPLSTSVKPAARSFVAAIGLAAACVASVPDLAAQGPSGAASTGFAAELEALLEQYGLPGLSVAVLRDDSLVYAGGIGLADIDAGTPATAAANYRIASLTKPLASTMLLRRAAAGTLDLDAPFKTLVPGYGQFFSRVRDYLMANEPTLAHLVEDYDFGRDDITVRHHLTHTAEGVPGTRFKYNGFLYGTLSRVLEVQAERPFAELLADEVFAPAGMNRTLATQADTSRPELLAALATPYTRRADATGFEEAPYPPTDVNAGAGVVSNVLDLAAFDRAIDQHTLLDAATQELAWTNYRLADGTDAPYGLGWFVQEIDGQRVVWHYGWQPGSFSGLYLKVPSEGLTLILLSNGENLTYPFADEGYREDVTASPFARAFLSAYLPEAGE